MGAGRGRTSEAKRSGASQKRSGVSKKPRTARGEKTRAAILDAARIEFGQVGFADSSIVAITQRAMVALGTFYTYFNSKEEVFAALVADMSARVRDYVAPALADATDGVDSERRALHAFLEFVRGHKEVYRIIDESEFVDPAGFEKHYRDSAARIRERLARAEDIRPAEDALEREVRAWAVMGMNVFLGLRFGVWGKEDPEAVARAANRLIEKGLG